MRASRGPGMRIGAGPCPKPPNISWGIVSPFVFVLACVIRDGAAGDRGNLKGLLSGLLAPTLLFGTSSMEAILIAFERRTGALGRLLLARCACQPCRPADSWAAGSLYW